MKTSTPAIRFGLFALTSAIILGTVALHSSPTTPVAMHAASVLPTTTLDTITVRPDAGEAVGTALAATALPMLPTVRVEVSEEEVLAARIDPTDRIQILSTIAVQPGADEIAAAMHATAVAQVAGDEESGFGGTFARAVVEPHRLRLDMPYYSFGKVLTRSSK